MNPGPLIIGHRGASAHAPENTLAAFQMALDAGADGLEFDVQLAKDGVPVVIHDEDLRRTGLRDEPVSSLTSKQLAKIDVGSWFNVKHPKKAHPEYAKETVPTLANVLEIQKNCSGLIYIELKCDEATYKPLAASVCELIRDSPMLPRVVVKSFRLAAIAEVRCLLPEVQTAALFEPSIITILRSRKYIIAMAREVGAHQISLHLSLATAKLTHLATDAGMPITLWTTDDPKRINKCRALGIRALISNDPAHLIAAAAV